MDPARHTMVSPTRAGPIDGVDEESTNNLDGERETAAVLEPAHEGELHSQATNRCGRRNSQPVKSDPLFYNVGEDVVGI